MYMKLFYPDPTACAKYGQPCGPFAQDCCSGEGLKCQIDDDYNPDVLGTCVLGESDQSIINFLAGLLVTYYDEESLFAHILSLTLIYRLPRQPISM